MPEPLHAKRNPCVPESTTGPSAVLSIVAFLVVTHGAGCAAHETVRPAAPRSATVAAPAVAAEPAPMGHAPPAAADETPAPTTRRCAAPLSLEEARPLLEAGLCGSGARFESRLVCDDWHAFLNGSAASLAPGEFAVGPTFRVEQANNGRTLWSEQNPLYVLYGGDGSFGLLDVSADNPEEEAEGQAYLRGAFAGTRDETSGLHRYLVESARSASRVPSKLVRAVDGLDLGCDGIVHVRAGAGRIYLLRSTKHGNAWEYDSHPVLYFSILAPPPSR